MTPRLGASALRRILAAAVLGACALAQTGCGFTPIYAAPSGNVAPMREVSVSSKGSSRLDYVFETTMADKLGAYQPSGAYQLQAVLSETRLGFGIRVDDVVTRYESTVSVQYQLVRASDGKVLASGSRNGVASYDVSDDPYGELSSEESALDRAVELVAEKIRLDLTLYFANASGGREDA